MTETERKTHLTLGRKEGQSIRAGDVRFKIVQIRGSQVRVLIEAPESVRVLRCELEHE